MYSAYIQQSNTDSRYEASIQSDVKDGCGANRTHGNQMTHTKKNHNRRIRLKDFKKLSWIFLATYHEWINCFVHESKEVQRSPGHKEEPRKSRQQNACPRFPLNASKLFERVFCICNFLERGIQYSINVGVGCCNC